MLVNRLSASFFIFLGLAFIYLIFPIEIEKLDYGWVRPQTLPNTCAFLLIVFGIFQFIFPKGKVVLEFEQILWSGVFVSAAFIAVFGFHKFGFIYTAPIFALSIMLLIGEKRILWLSLGTIVIPFSVWMIVENLLGRLLP